jgi:CheY-like chemotaxis protein
MDVQMPVMDGIEAVARIREVERAQGGHIPVVAVTAHAMDRDRLNLLSKGFDGYVSKPTKIKDLFSEMKRCLARQPGNSPD